ncbi:MAG: GIY-YIG nuclease family protein [Chitinophagaceae bacterium]|nr:GIY-YIG nuclease family protein [Chitinophagaceae bacterium]
MYKVYILYSEKIDKYYIGQTHDFVSRLSFHNDLVRNKIWSRRGIPWVCKILFTVQSRYDAILLERFIKNQKSSGFIEDLLHQKFIIFNKKIIASDPDYIGKGRTFESSGGSI